MNANRSLVNAEHRFVYWFHPKCASTNLKAWFSAVMGDEPTWGSGCQVNNASVHDWVKRYPRYEVDLHSGYYHFTVIRHPLARLVSHYRQQIQAGPAYTTIPNQISEAQRYDTFRQFCNIILNAIPKYLDQHVGPVSPTLRRVPLNRTLKTDTLRTQWASVPVPHHVRLRYDVQGHTDPVPCTDWPSARFLEEDARPPWTSYFDRQLRSSLEWYFSEDIKRFEAIDR